MLSRKLFCAIPYGVTEIDRRFMKKLCVALSRTHNDSAYVAAHWEKQPVVYIATWEGSHAYCRDAEPNFKEVFFCFTGKPIEDWAPNDHAFNKENTISIKTDCKGDIIRELAKIESDKKQLRIIGMIDHDVSITSSQINQLLEIGRENQLGLWQSSMRSGQGLTVNWDHLKTTDFSSPIREVPCIEGMMPFMLNSCIVETAQASQWNISSWGLDEYTWTFWAAFRGVQPTVINSVAVENTEETSSYNRVFRNGLTAANEHNLARSICRRAISLTFLSKDISAPNFLKNLSKVGAKPLQDLVITYSPVSRVESKSRFTERVLSLLNKFYRLYP